MCKEISDEIKEQSQDNIVRLGRLATTIQRRHHGDNTNRKRDEREAMLCFNIAVDAVIGAWRLGFRDRESLTFAVAGELEDHLRRSKLNKLEGDALIQRCLKWAEKFINAIWFGLWNGNPPSNRARHTIEPIYRIAFLMAPEDQDNGNLIAQ